MTQNTVATSHEPGKADDLARAVRAASRKGPPPVHLWNPPFCGDLDMRIKADGSWWYLGTPIGRIELVKLFASVLRRDDDDYFLVTPVEKVGITVDDAPFLAVDFTTGGTGEGQSLTFETSLGDKATAGPDHPIRVERAPGTGEPRPYFHIRARLEALIDRKSFYRLVEIGNVELVDGIRMFGLRSDGVFFPVIEAQEMGL